MSDGIVLSIIIPCYNSETTIDRCLDSVLSQKIDGLEIICIDDSSTDGTGSILRKYRDEGRIRLIIHEQNTGAYTSRIDGLKEACGDYFMFLDSDDTLSDDYLKNMINCSVSHNANIVVSNVKYIAQDNTESILFSHNSDRFLVQPDLLNEFLATNGSCFQWYVVWGKLFRSSFKDIILDIDRTLPRVRVLEDLLLMSSLLTEIDSLFFSTDLYNYRYNINSSTHKSLDYSSFLASIKDVQTVLQTMNTSVNSQSSFVIRNWRKYFHHIWKKKIVTSHLSKIQKIQLTIILWNNFH